MKTIKISKLDIALVQLETAIKLFLNDKNYISAATLAGASEEILGKYVAQAGDTNAFTELCAALKDEFNLLIPVEVVGRNFVNFHRNELKHFNNPENEEIEIDDQTEAACLIVRSIINLITHDKSITHNTQEFLDWLHKNRKDLMT